jgi:hypothetical protein
MHFNILNLKKRFSLNLLLKFYSGLIFSRYGLQERLIKGNHSPACSEDVKDEWSCTSTYSQKLPILGSHSTIVSLRQDSVLQLLRANVGTVRHISGVLHSLGQIQPSRTSESTFQYKMPIYFQGIIKKQ